MSLETIKERADAATPGPWSADGGYAIRGATDDVLVMVDKADVLMEREDAAFIAHARQDIPALLRVAEAADEARAGLGSVMWVANNAHNHKLDDFRLLLELALEDWRKGYDALVAALDELEALP